jgi:hypothetical protein
MEKISIELRNQYVVGYKPSNLVRDGRWRRVKVKLTPQKGRRRSKCTPARVTMLLPSDRLNQAA